MSVLTPKRVVNGLLFPLRLRLENLPRDYFDLSLYECASRSAAPKYLNIGALDFDHPLWHKLDNPTEWGPFQKRQTSVDIAHDLMSGEPLPLADGSLRIAYCSHVIEHLRDEDVRRLCREVFRALEPGGTFRLVAPDARIFYEAYQRGDAHQFRRALVLYSAPSLEQKLLMQFASALVLAHPARGHRKCGDEEVRGVFQSEPMDRFFDTFSSRVPFEVQRAHPADHINWFTHEKTMAFLREAGFADVRRSACHQSTVPVLRNPYLFDPYPDHSLYVECTK